MWKVVERYDQLEVGMHVLVELKDGEIVEGIITNDSFGFMDFDYYDGDCIGFINSNPNHLIPNMEDDVHYTAVKIYEE